MLNESAFEEDLKKSLSIVLTGKENYVAGDDIDDGALYEAVRALYQGESSDINNIARKFAETFATMFIDSISKAMAVAITTHIKTADVYGTIKTMGSPTSQVSRQAPPGVVMGAEPPGMYKLKLQ